MVNCAAPNCQIRILKYVFLSLRWCRKNSIFARDGREIGGNTAIFVCINFKLIMKEFVSKLSLYDLLAMFLPGMLIFVFMTLVMGYELSVDECRAEKFISWTVFFLVSYLLGIINHVATSALVRIFMFRNNSNMISRAFKDVYRYCSQNARLCEIADDVKESGSTPSCMCRLLGILSIILLGIILYGVFKDESVHLRYLLILPFLIYSIIFLFISCCGRCSKSDSRKVVDHYYKAYYYVAPNSYSKDVSVMEGQVAFMQSMIVPLILYLFVPKCELSCLLGLFGNLENLIYLMKGVLLVSIIILLVAINLRQMKIYQRVWEDYAYL